MRTRLLASIACLVTASFAHAARAESPATVDASASDPGAGQLLVSSTALTQPAGALTIASHMGLTGVTYGANDRVEIGGYLLPLFLVAEDHRVAGVLTAKLAAVKTGPVRVAIEVRAGALDQRWTRQWYVEASAIATGCLDPACANQLNAEATIGARAITGSSDDGGGERDRETRLAVGAQVRIVDHVKLVADVAWAREEDAEGNASDGLLLAPGVRIHGRTWMVQASVAVDALSGSALPWVSAAYRF